ncbi:SDR family NAD(P)-dependent oxidoreductase [Roseibium alexandrii]|uniref:Dehydrogenase with different specificity n=1 Tax=Roseibium alexandrii (strain DSM 17067 / NCIMB 14079 / DFL-11) TaxID=244592 RepID=A0A5E8GZ06_ROSAD|nr:SDR family oxidoreductase [Roseibium alexandrii]EEE45138.1 Dehydrogenase with different specificity [Roseibium alexandrii DFL-11]
MADQRFSGQTVMITGAAGGFGAEAARKFAALGARLALSDRDESGLEQIRTELQDIGADVWVEAYDVGNENETKAHVDQILERFGSLDIALNNAGICHDLKPLTQLAVDDLDRMFAVNVRGVFLGMKYQIPVMAKAGRGAIINMASAAGLVGAGMLSAYAASKHAVVGLTRSAADETGRIGVRINAVCPSFAQTAMYQNFSEALAESQNRPASEIDAAFTKRSPMGRVIRSDEVISAVLWLADPHNTAVHGQAIPVDGGLTAV